MLQRKVLPYWLVEMIIWLKWRRRSRRNGRREKKCEGQIKAVTKVAV